MTERIPRKIDAVNKPSQEEVDAADKFLKDSVLMDSDFTTEAEENYKIDDFQDTIPAEAEPHDFLDSDTIDNSRVTGLELTEAPGDLKNAEAVLHKPPQPAKVMQNIAEKPQTITGLLNDHSQIKETISYKGSPEGRRQTEREANKKKGFWSRLFGG
jgi:hypothetical protein